LGVVGWLRWFWRQLSSMRTALFLLLLLALAAVPVGPVLATVLWLDRHEAEPPHLLAFAFGWGACVASLGALVVNTGVAKVLDRAVGDVTNTSVLVAPLVEEALKGLGVLLLLLKQRKEFDGVVDGIVYALDDDVYVQVLLTTLRFFCSLPFLLATQLLHLHPVATVCITTRASG
jgi:hypothetical protein